MYESLVAPIWLSKGQVTYVNMDYYDYLSQWKWYCHKGYARRSARKDDSGKRRVVHLSREVWKLAGNELPDGYIIDHINGNKLDNRLRNLRACRQCDNVINTKPYRTSNSGYRGVFYRPELYPKNSYVARVSFRNKQYNLGCFKTAEEAAEAYNKKAKELHGEFAVLNDV